MEGSWSIICYPKANRGNSCDCKGREESIAKWTHEKKGGRDMEKNKNKPQQKNTQYKRKTNKLKKRKKR